MFNKISIIRFIGILLYALIGLLASEINYGILQLEGQLKVIRESKPINEFLSDPNFSADFKEKIKFIQEVREFGINELGMTDSKNYTTLYDQKGEPTLWVVTAAPRFNLTPFEWKFPIVGGFPYKGFFKKELVKAEAKKIKNLGYDVEIDVVSAWSTLGWFPDPILSTNLEKSKADLANLILHELTHTTIYVKDSAEMNENLASFIGHQGAVAFLNQYPGGDTLLADYLNKRKDRDLFIDFMKSELEALKLNYENSVGLPINERLASKERQIKSIRTALNQIQFETPNAFQSVKDGSYPLNNAYFSGFNTYNKQQTNFQSIFETEFNGNLRSFLDSFKEKYPTL